MGGQFVACDRGRDSIEGHERSEIFQQNKHKKEFHRRDNITKVARDGTFHSLMQNRDL